jgi:hypothetical protein
MAQDTWGSWRAAVINVRRLIRNTLDGSSVWTLVLAGPPTRRKICALAGLPQPADELCRQLGKEAPRQSVIHLSVGHVYDGSRQCSSTPPYG